MSNRQKLISTIGKATHFRPNNRNLTACGMVWAEFQAYDARDVDCLRCIKTKKYRIYMGLTNVGVI